MYTDNTTATKASAFADTADRLPMTVSPCPSVATTAAYGKYVRNAEEKNVSEMESRTSATDAMVPRLPAGSQNRSSRRPRPKMA